MIRSLISYPSKMNARAILTSLEYKIKADMENWAYRVYTARALQILTEDMSHAFGGKSMAISYEDFINPKPFDNRSAEQIIEDIKGKMNS